MSTTNIYCDFGSYGTRLLRAHAFKCQFGLKTPSFLLECGISAPNVAVKIFNRFLESNSYIQVGEDGVTIYGGIQCDTKYTEESFWEGVFREEHCSIGYWDSLFQDDRRYREVDLAERIPGDKYQCMVFHHIHKWSERFREFFCDGKVCEGKKVALLKKQMRNIAFFSKERAFGSLWHMKSKPDILFKQALDGGGDTVRACDSDGNQLIDIAGRPLYVKSCGYKSDGAIADGPKPDNMDKVLYNGISKHAGWTEPPKHWTMVRSSFSTDRKEVRCYAFSGLRGSNKQLHTIPAQWWDDGNKDNFLEENRDIYFCNVDQNRLSQHMILAVFDSLQESIHKDLETLTKHIAFQDNESWESLIQKNRNDLKTVDYLEYFYIVKSRIHRAEKTIITALTNFLKSKSKVENTEDFIRNKIWTMVSVGANNKQFEPNFDELKKVECLDDQTVDTIGRISKGILGKLEQELTKLPTEFLNKMKKRLQQCHCGEDNVLSLLLQKYLETVIVFGTSPVEFVALDGDNLGGKPFCEVCDRKVRFYSVLPTFLQELGVSGNDQEFLSHLTTLFAKMAENP